MDFICPHKCSYRTSSGYCGSTGGWESCQYRIVHQPNTVVGYVPPIKKTNADRIRAMTDEELAVKIEELCQYTLLQIKTYAKPNGRAEWLDWLKQEVEE